MTRSNINDVLTFIPFDAEHGDNDAIAIDYDQDQNCYLVWNMQRDGSRVGTQDRCMTLGEALQAAGKRITQTGMVHAADIQVEGNWNLNVVDQVNGNKG